MQLSNYHSHCTFCDGRSNPEEFIKFAIAQGFRAYGFSSHSPLPFETFWNMSKEDMPDYLAEIERLKQKYADRIEIYTGLEIDYLDETYNPSINYFSRLPLDYRIGSIHFMPIAYPLAEKNMVCIDGPYTEFQQAVDQLYEGDIRKITAHYFKNLLQMVETGGFDIVGHPDKIYMNGQRCPGFSMQEAWYREPFEHCLQRIADKGLMVEINTKNFTRKGEFYPHADYLHRLCELQIPVMVNSDSHYPDKVNSGREAAFELLKKAGFKATRELIRGRWEDIPLKDQIVTGL